MKKLLFSCLGICFFSSISFVYADCVQDCIDNGNDASYCREICTPSIDKPPEIYPRRENSDKVIKCYNDCRSRGYPSEYCADECNYNN